MFLALLLITIRIKTHNLLSIVFYQRIVAIILRYVVLPLNHTLLLRRELNVLYVCHVFLWRHSVSDGLFLLLLHEELRLILRQRLKQLGSAILLLLA